jgi:hypothetical protein
MRPALLFLAFLPACVFAEDQRPLVDADLEVAGKYVFRGQVMNDRPVLQGALATALPTRDDGAVLLRAWTNVDLAGSTGRAWFDDGHGGEPTEIDLSLGYGRRIGPVDVAVGVLRYEWPNHERFPFQPFPSTTEVFARIDVDAGVVAPALEVHHDLEDANGVYVRPALRGQMPLADRLTLELEAFVGWSDQDHSRWLYRRPDNAISDVGGGAVLAFDLDDLTRLHAGIRGSSIVEDELRSWFRGRVDADNLWFVVGARLSW